MGCPTKERLYTFKECWGQCDKMNEKLPWENSYTILNLYNQDFWIRRMAGTKFFKIHESLCPPLHPFIYASVHCKLQNIKFINVSCEYSGKFLYKSQRSVYPENYYLFFFLTQKTIINLLGIRIFPFQNMVVY